MSKRRKRYGVTIILALVSVFYAHSELVWDIWGLQMGDVKLVEEPVDVFIPASEHLSLQPVSFPDSWEKINAVTKARGSDWIFEVDVVWFRYRIPNELINDELIAISIFGSPTAFISAAVSVEPIGATFSYYIFNAEELELSEFLYVKVEKPSGVPGRYLRGPAEGFESVLRGAYTAFDPLPMRLEWSVYGEKDSLDGRTWYEQRSFTPEIGRNKNFAVRFSLPSSYNGSAVDILSAYGVKHTEILIDGRRYYARGFRELYQAPEAAALHWSITEAAVRIPPADSHEEIEIRWSFIYGSALSRAWESGRTIDPSILIFPADLLYRGMAISPSPILRNLGSIFLSILGVIIFIAGFARGGAGRRPFIILSLLAVSAAIASSDSLDGFYLVFRSIPILRWTPGILVSSVKTLCLFAIGPLLIAFHRASTKHTAGQLSKVVSWIVIGFAAAGYAMGFASGVVEGIPLALVFIILGLVSVGTGASVVIHARESVEPEVNRALVAFATLFVSYMIYAILAAFTPVIKIDARLFFTANSISIILIVLPLMAIPLFVYRRVERELRDANVVFRRFVPDEFLKFLGIQQLIDIRPGKQIEVLLTVMFCDIRSFTSLAERMQPREVMSFVNRYLEFAGPVIRENGGFVDKYMGDGVMALFPGEEAEALRAGVQIVTGLPSLDLEIAANAGIGLHRGHAMLGTVGDHGRLDTTVLSDAVNVASRLQSLSAGYGAGILASSDAVAQKTGTLYYARFVDSVRLKGRETATQVYEILPAKRRDLLSPLDEIYEQAFKALSQRDLGEAHRLISDCLSGDPTDPIYRMLNERIQDFRLDRHCRWSPVRF
ncbi:MAG: hypothetical protein CMN78_04250 [Spirochaetales bacterium]|nr:hypothetical protein [Spirochaetales bacterium]